VEAEVSSTVAAPTMKVLRRTTQELAFASADIACTTTAMASNIATTAVELGGCDSSLEKKKNVLTWCQVSTFFLNGIL